MKKQSQTTKHTALLFLQHAVRYPRYVAGICVTVPATILIYGFLPPIILASVLTRLSQGDFQPHDVWGEFGASLVAYTVLMLLGGTVMWRVVDAFAWRLEANVQRDLANRVYQHLLNQSASFHANHFGGSLVSQNNKLLGAYVRVADTTMFQVLPLVSSLVWTSVILVARAPLFVALLWLFSIFYVAISILITRHIRELSASHAGAESQQTGYLADSITNIMAIKSFASGSFEQKQYKDITESTRRRLRRLGRGAQKQLIVLTSITNLISALSLIMGVVGIMVFGASFATVFLILSYTAVIVRQLWEFGNTALRNYNRAFGDASDMTEILQLEPEVQDLETVLEPAIHRGAIQFQDVTFTYPEDDEDDTLFENLNLKIKPGEKIGLIGHSGGGKTTVTKLLLRFMDIQDGEILIDGQNIAHLSQDALRSHIAYVPQEPLLFHRTLLENIRYGRPEASEKETTAVAKMAHADEFIQKLPKKYETLVGERGVKLSGGQRQRVAIARAMLKNAPIIVLDEATSALDSESEGLIQDALWHLMEGRTAIVIAHRLSTIQKMDRIVVLEEGQIVEEGSHKELLAKKGVYAELWAHQSGGFLEE